MKTFAMTALAALLMSPVYAGGLSDPIVETHASAVQDLSDRNSGLTHRIMCSNVPARSGSVPGIYASNLGFFVEENSAPYATTSRIAGVIPAGLSSKDEDDVKAYFASVGLTNYELVIRKDTDTRIELREVETKRGEEPVFEEVVVWTSRKGSWCK